MNDTLDEAAERGVDEATIWNQRRVTDDLRSPRSRIRDLVDEVTRAHGSTPAEILSKDRLTPIVAARRAAILAVARAYPWFSLNQLGRIFQRHHTTIVSALAASGFRVSQNGTYKERRSLWLDEKRGELPEPSNGENHELVQSACTDNQDAATKP